jgi:hypothetical protein
MSIIAHVLVPLAEKAPDPADVKPGWLGFGMFLALAAATVLLWLSFRRQLKKVRFDVPPLPPRRPGEAARSTIASRPDPAAPTDAAAPPGPADEQTGQ